MSTIRVRKGLNIPINGAVDSLSVVDGPGLRRVALLPADFPGIKVRMLVKEGQEIRRGSPLFLDRRDEEVMYTAPAGGRVVAVNRGKRRKVLSVVIEIGADEGVKSFPALDPETADRREIKSLLSRSGLWTCIRQRPFNKVAFSKHIPSSLFITAADTQPLAVPPSAILAGREEDFLTGMKVLSRLTDGLTYLCTMENDASPAYQAQGSVQHRVFSGPHPAGNAGVHINALDPVGTGKIVWHVGYQDVAAIGALVRNGKVPTERVVALVGPGVAKRRLIRTRRGAALADLIGEASKGRKSRVISGSALSGKTAEPDGPEGFLGGYDNQITILEDEVPKEFLGWALPGLKKYSLTNTFPGKFFRREFAFNTAMNGSLRAVVPIGMYEKVMPMDIMPTFLIKALAADDIETAEKLGVLELAEEDMALCSFVCPSKIDITTLLRKMLTRIEKEG